MKHGQDRPLRELGENRMVSRFRELTAKGLGRGVLAGPGDDAALVRIPENRLLLFTCDMTVEGVHFRRAWATPRQIGWKAMAANVSDIGAMGGEPGFAVASVAAPGEVTGDFLDEIAEGLMECASRYGASLVGGDLVGSPGPVVVDVALTGWIAEGLALRRSGARAGDAVLVTGALGASAAGLAALRQGLSAEDERVGAALTAHLTPCPRLVEGQAIAAAKRATAMMDLSDGLAEDLPRLCRESNLGARLQTSQIPVHPSCRAVAELLGLDALALAVSGGEDYELLLTCPPDAVKEVREAVAAAGGVSVTVIGEMVSEEGVVTVEDSGLERAMGAGFDHFAVSG